MHAYEYSVAVPVDWLNWGQNPKQLISYERGQVCQHKVAGGGFQLVSYEGGEMCQHHEHAEASHTTTPSGRCMLVMQLYAPLELGVTERISRAVVDDTSHTRSVESREQVTSLRRITATPRSALNQHEFVEM